MKIESKNTIFDNAFTANFIELLLFDENFNKHSFKCL